MGFDPDGHVIEFELFTLGADGQPGFAPSTSTPSAPLPSPEDPAVIVLDHHIVPSRQRDEAACWLTSVLGLPAPRREGPFAAVDLGGATALYFAGWNDDAAPQHYAFAVGRDDFDRIVERLVDGNVEHWADHNASQSASVRRDATGNGVYFRSPDGHLLEVLTHR